LKLVGKTHRVLKIEHREGGRGLKGKNHEQRKREDQKNARG